MGRKIMLTPSNFMQCISQYQMAFFPDAGMHFIQILRFMCLDRTRGYELCSSWVTPADGEGLHPLASQAFMNYKNNLYKGKVAIRDVYAIIARHLPPDDPTYLSSLSAAELEEMASRDVGWEPRPIAFDAMTLDEALQTAMPAGAPKAVAQRRTSGVAVAGVAM